MATSLQINIKGSTTVLEGKKVIKSEFLQVSLYIAMQN